MDGFEVTPEVLLAAAVELCGIAEEAHRNAAAFSGVQDALNDQALGFDLMRAAAQCESSWQAAIQSQGAKLAIDGDTLALNAAGYVGAELRNTRALGGR